MSKTILVLETQCRFLRVVSQKGMIAWALDTLIILLSDDAAVGFFRLGHLPGVLDTVGEHFRRNLISVFDVLRESEIQTEIPERLA